MWQRVCLFLDHQPNLDALAIGQSYHLGWQAEDFTPLPVGLAARLYTLVLSSEVSRLAPSSTMLQVEMPKLRLLRFDHSDGARPSQQATVFSPAFAATARSVELVLQVKQAVSLQQVPAITEASYGNVTVMTVDLSDWRISSAVLTDLDYALFVADFDFVACQLGSAILNCDLSRVLQRLTIRVPGPLPSVHDGDVLDVSSKLRDKCGRRGITLTVA